MNCPRCGEQLEQDFGVVTCHSCSAVLFIDMDGNIQEGQPEAGDSFSANPSETSKVKQAQDLETIIQAPQTFVGSAVTGEEKFSDEDMASPQEPNENFLENLSEHAADGEEIIIPEVAIAPNDFSDVQNFANSDKELPPITYDVLIEDINTHDQRESLKKALSDPRFQWEVRDLIGAIKKGNLEIRKLHPVKTSILIFRLKDLSLKVSWRQNVFEV